MSSVFYVSLQFFLLLLALGVLGLLVKTIRDFRLFKLECREYDLNNRDEPSNEAETPDAEYDVIEDAWREASDRRRRGLGRRKGKTAAELHRAFSAEREGKFLAGHDGSVDAWQTRRGACIVFGDRHRGAP